MSSFYNYNVVAKIGDLGLQDLSNRPSINDLGQVAFTGDFDTGEFGSEGIIVGNGLSTPRNIAPSSTQPDQNLSSRVQINNNGQVIATFTRNTGGVFTGVRLYESNSTSNFELIASGGGALTGSFYPFDYFSVLPIASVNNSGQSVFTAIDKEFNFDFFFPAYEPGDNLLVTSANPQTNNNSFNELTLSSINGVRPKIADNGNVVVNINDRIELYNFNLSGSPQTIASSSNFSSLGQSPGISDDGQIVVFSGDRGNGEGIFLYSSLLPSVIRVAGENRAGGRAELGYDDAGNPIFFDSIDLDDAIGITRFDLGASGLEDDSIVVTFMGTPNSASVTNPITGNPLLFDNKEGIWKVRVDFESELSGSRIVAHPTGAVPVVQVGDQINGATINDLNIYDPISNATQDLAGNPRSQQLGEHRIAFWADTTAGEMVITAEHLGSYWKFFRCV